MLIEANTIVVADTIELKPGQVLYVGNDVVRVVGIDEAALSLTVTRLPWWQRTWHRLRRWLTRR
jgi:hypothetical protein